MLTERLRWRSTAQRDIRWTLAPRRLRIAWLLSTLPDIVGPGHTAKGLTGMSGLRTGPVWETGHSKPPTGLLLT